MSTPTTPTTGTNPAIIKKLPIDPTNYVILRDVSVEGVDQTWQQVATIPAQSANAAIRAHADKTPPKGAERFVAVPERSWRPVSVALETRQVVKLT